MRGSWRNQSVIWTQTRDIAKMNTRMEVPSFGCEAQVLGALCYGYAILAPGDIRRMVFPHTQLPGSSPGPKRQSQEEPNGWSLRGCRWSSPCSSHASCWSFVQDGWEVRILQFPGMYSRKWSFIRRRIIAQTLLLSLTFLIHKLPVYRSGHAVHGFCNVLRSMALKVILTAGLVYVRVFSTHFAKFVVVSSIRASHLRSTAMFIHDCGDKCQSKQRRTYS